MKQSRLFEPKISNELPISLREQFLTPPLSILDAKSGYWMGRKRQWEEILGDVKNNVRNSTAKSNTPYINSFTKPDFLGMKSPTTGNISTFDPFLCEILIKWFTRPGMLIYDPFAGGIVRGGVAGLLDRDYIGVDICKEQVEHNIQEWILVQERFSKNKNSVQWIWGDSAEIELDQKADALLTCPPYYNLERYTNDIRDLSNLSTYSEFIQKLLLIIEKCYNNIKEDSFAMIVVEEIRDGDGILYGFVPDVIKKFQEVGFRYYNELILENRVVSTAIRSKKYFVRTRKVGRHHQNVLIFYKGNLDNIEEKFGGINI